MHDPRRRHRAGSGTTDARHRNRASARRRDRPRLRCLVLLGGFSGLRRGELLGLQRRDVDPLHYTVIVERQAQELTGLGHVLTPPKSEAGRRTVGRPPRFRLARARGASAGLCGAICRCVLVHRPTALSLRRQDLSHAWRAACAVVGIDGVRPHDLRHHAAPR